MTWLILDEKSERTAEQSVLYFGSYRRAPLVRAAEGQSPWPTTATVCASSSLGWRPADMATDDLRQCTPTLRAAPIRNVDVALSSLWARRPACLTL